MRYLASIYLLLIFSPSIFAHEGIQTHLLFIENKGQWDSNILYKTDIKNGAIFLEQNKLTVHVSENRSHRFKTDSAERPCKGHVYQIEFLGCNLNPNIIPSEKTNEYFNYFLDSDPLKWKGGCSAFETIRYLNIYPNIDLVISSKNFQPKYSFFLKKGAKVDDIKIKFKGLSNIYLNEKGDLISVTSLGSIIDEKPIAFIHKEGQRKEIYSSFLLNDSIVKFSLENYELNDNELLEIDPQIIFSTYSGSTADNFGASATYDHAGNLYGTGLIFGTGYVTTTGAYQTSFGGSSDIAITKFNATGSSRVYSTYIGGSSYDVPHSLVVDQNDRLLLLATTSSSGYPTTTGAFRTTFSGGPPLNSSSAPIPSLNGLGISYPNGADIAITKFNSTGTTLVGSTFFGGSGTDGVGTSTSLIINYGDGIRGEVETDTFGNVYIASVSNSNNLPTVTGGFKTTNSGGFDGVLAKFNTNLTNLLSFTYVGGSGDDALYDLCFDNTGNIIAAGGTSSSNLATTSGVVSTSYGGNTDGLIVSFNNILTTQRFSSYYGTSDYDQIYFVETDKAGLIYVLGQTTHSSSNYYIVSAGFSNPHKGQFVSVLNSTLTAKIRSTTFGAGNQNPDISPTAFLVDYCDKIFITGWGSNLGSFNTFSLSTSGLPVTSNAFQSSTLGNGFYMMILEGNLSAQYYGSFFGGTTSVSEEHVDGGTSRFDKNGIIYHAVCAGCGGNQNFPIFPNAASVVSGTNNSSNCNLGVFKFDFGLPVNADFTYTPACAPVNLTFQNLSHTVSNGTQYKWSFSNGATSTAKDPTIYFASPGVYTARLIIIDSSSCNIADTLSKFIIVLGTVGDTLADKIICKGSSVRIGFPGVSSTGMTIKWNPTNTIDDSTILAPFASPSVTTQYRVILSKTGCTDTFYQRVIIDTSRPLIISGDSMICTGVSIAFTATNYTGGTYDWLPKSILTSANQDTGRYTFTVLPATISVSYTSPNGCTSSAKKSLVQGTPSIDLIADSIVCKGDIVRILSKTTFNGGTFSYSPSSMFQSKSGDTIVVKVDTTSNFKVNYVVSSICQAVDSISFKILKDAVKWRIDSLICYNQNAVATAILDSSYSIVWQPAATLTTIQGKSPAQFNLSNTDRFVYIQVTHNAKSYCTFNDSAKVRFLENSVRLRADTTRCSDSLVTIYHGNLKGTTKSWTPSTNLVSQSDTSATFRVFSTTVFKLLVNDLSCTVQDSIKIKIINESIHITGDSIVCSKDTAFLRIDSMKGATYNWLPATAVISGRTDAQAFVRVSSPQWFYIHVQDTNNCYMIDSFFVNNFDSTKSVKGDFSANTNCQSLNVDFKNKSRGVSTPTYQWNFSNQGLSTTTNPSFSFTSFGMKNVTLIISDTGSCNLSDTITKAIYILNNQSIQLPQLKYCKGDSAQLGLTSMIDSLATVNWTPNAGMVGFNTFQPKIRLYTSSSFIAYISKNGCKDTWNQSVIIDSPSTIKIQGDTLACRNSEKLYTATHSSTGSYTWHPNSSISYQNRDSVKMIVGYDYFWVRLNYISDFGCLSRDSMQIRTIPTSIQLTMDTVGCKDEKLFLRYNTLPKGGNLTFNPSSNILSFNDSVASYLVDTTRILTVSYKINNACQASQSLRFMLLKDAVNWKYDSVSCRNNSIQAQANTSPLWSLSWSPTALLQSSQGISPARFGNFTNNGKIYIQTTLNQRSTCSFQDSAVIKLLENTVKIKGKNSNCKDSFIRLEATLIPNAVYTWGPNSALFNASGNIANFKTEVSRFYYVTVTYNNLCSFVDSIYIQVGNSDLKLHSDSIVCPNDTVTLYASLLPNASYLWSNGVSTNTNQVRLSQTSVFYVTVIDSSGCRLTDSLKVFAFDKSSIYFTNKDSVNCRFDTLVLDVNYFPKVFYDWFPSSLILSGNGTHRIKSFILKDTKFLYQAYLYRGIGCTLIDSINIVKDTQYLKISGNKLVCKEDTLTLTATDNSSFKYQWSPTNWIINEGRRVQYKIIDSTWIRCAVSSSRFPKCPYRDSIKADYSRELENLQVTATPDKIEYGSSTTLHASATNIIDYVWTPRATLSNPFVPSPTAKPDTTTTYYVTVKNPLGCRGGDSVIVTVFYEECADPEVYLPTGFTPNNDGKNDALYVRGDNILHMHLMIYDRWGQLVFESDHQKKGWDGKFKGIELEPSVYAYFLHVECIGGGSFSKKGNITLIK